MNRKKSNEVPRGSPCKINANHGIRCSPKEDASPQKSNEIPWRPLQNGREFMEIERNPKGIRTYTFQNECKSMHPIVAI
jgi:hypothetical protein